MQSVDDFYELCEILGDDLELVALCLKEVGRHKSGKGKLLRMCENLEHKKLHKYVIKCLNTPCRTMIAWRDFKSELSINKHQDLENID